MDTGSGRGTGPGGTGSGPCPTCGGGTRQDPEGSWPGRQGPEAGRVQGGNARGRKWKAGRCCALILALAPTCYVTLNKSPPPLWDLFSPAVSAGWDGRVSGSPAGPGSLREAGEGEQPPVRASI